MQLRLHQRQLRRTGRSNGRMVWSQLLHTTRTGFVASAWRRNEFESGGQGRAPPLVWHKSTISRFGERFRDGLYSFASFLFAVLLLTVPPCPMESAPLFVAMLCVAISH